MGLKIENFTDDEEECVDFVVQALYRRRCVVED